MPLKAIATGLIAVALCLAIPSAGAFRIDANDYEPGALVFDPTSPVRLSWFDRGRATPTTSYRPVRSRRIDCPVDPPVAPTPGFCGTNALGSSVSSAAVGFFELELVLAERAEEEGITNPLYAGLRLDLDRPATTIAATGFSQLGLALLALDGSGALRRPIGGTSDRGPGPPLAFQSHEDTWLFEPAQNVRTVFIGGLSDVARVQSVSVAVPEPSALALLALGALWFFGATGLGVSRASPTVARCALMSPGCGASSAARDVEIIAGPRRTAPLKAFGINTPSSDSGERRDQSTSKE